MKEFKWKIFTNRNFVNFSVKTVYLGLKFVLNKNESYCSTTCFIVRLAPLAGKASSTLMFRNVISLKLVAGTYMGGFTPVYNGKKNIRSSTRTFIEYLFDSVYEKSTISAQYPTGKILFHPLRILTSYYKLTLKTFLILIVVL